MSKSTQPFRTDALNPSSLPTASLGHLRPLSSRSHPTDPSDPNAKSTFEASHDEWNIRIDREVKAVAEGLKDLINLSDVRIDTSAHDPTVQGLHLKLQTARLIRSTQNVRDMAHELRMMLMLADEVDTARRRDVEVRSVREEVKRCREEVGREIERLLSGRGG